MTDKKEIIKNLEEYLQEEMWRYTEPPLGKEECELFLKLLKQKEERPKGKWIIDDLEFGRVWKCHCSICNKNPLDYVYGTENWWLCKTQMPKCCPSCGAVMREVN